MDSATDRLPRLPACQLCYQKKVKCDSTRPKCTPCTKSGSECVVLNSSGEKLLSRADIARLEQQEKELTARVRLQTLRDDSVLTERATDQPNTEVGRTVASIDSSNVSHGEGLSFIASLFTDPDLRRNNAELLQILARVPNVPSPTIEPCQLPCKDDAEILFDKYLSWSHIQSPFLCRDEVKDLHRRVFASPTPPVNQSTPDYDLFRTFLILAVGSVLPHRNGTHDQHPEGYYLAALQHMGVDFLTRGLSSVQDLLLVCRFGIYYRIGTSIWDVIRLCGRLCVEQGLHLDDNQDNETLLHAQMKRRVFWQFYMFDRYSSTLLGKPFTIDDRDIETSFPADANDHDLIAASSSLSLRDLAAFQMSHIPVSPNEMTVFFASVRLRQISSRIHTEFLSLARNHSEPSQSHLAPGHIYMALNRLMQDLDIWRENAPVFRQPQCLFESQDWYDLLLAREKLYLVRRAIDLVPKRDGKTPRHLSLLCLKTALRTIQVYSSLCQNRPFITHTRSYFHMMFTAGLSVMFCVSAATALDTDDVLHASAGLSQCEETLRDMMDQLPSARHYVIVFEALRRNTSRKLNRVLESLRSDQGQQNAASNQTTLDLSADVLTRHLTHSAVFDSHNSAATAATTAFGAVHERTTPGSQSEGLGHHPLHQFNFSFPPARQPGDMTSIVGTQAQYSSLGIPDNFSPGSDLFDWAFLNDETLWNMETVLGEYVYGDPGRNPGFPDSFEF